MGLPSGPLAGGGCQVESTQPLPRSWVAGSLARLEVEEILWHGLLCKWDLCEPVQTDSGILLWQGYQSDSPRAAGSLSLLHLCVCRHAPAAVG